MRTEMNEWGQPVGGLLSGWRAPEWPAKAILCGSCCRLEPLDPARHGDDIFDALAQGNPAMWTYMGYGPFASAADYQDWMAKFCMGQDPLCFAIVEPDSGRALGVAAYMRIDPAAGCIEVGHLLFSPALQRTRMATEAMYLMMREAFALGYRRYEWKCNALNAPSRQAALRLGFSFEGVFRQALVVKGRNRDTAWYSIIDSEWPALEFAFQRWLSDENFDTEGRQRRRLSHFHCRLLD